MGESLIQVTLSEEQIHNICICLVRTAKSAGVSEDEMIYLITLSKYLKRTAGENDNT